MGMRCGGTTLAVLVGVAITVVVPGSAAGQAPSAAAAAGPRTSEGHPDLQGVVWVTGPDSVLYTETSKPGSPMKRPE